MKNTKTTAGIPGGLSNIFVNAYAYVIVAMTSCFVFCEPVGYTCAWQRMAKVCTVIDVRE